MFRIAFEDVGSSVLVRIEGRFVSQFAEEARLLVSRRKAPKELIVDISDVIAVDAVGEEVLTWLRLMGATFVANRSCALRICERLNLPVTATVDGTRAG